MAIINLVSTVYHAVCVLKLKANSEQPLKMLQEFEEQEGGFGSLIPVYGASLCYYIGHEVEEVCKAVEELPVAHFNLCFKECIPMGGFSAYSLSMAIALHIVTYVLEANLQTVEEYTQFMQNQFMPLSYNEV